MEKTDPILLNDFDDVPPVPDDNVHDRSPDGKVGTNLGKNLRAGKPR